MFTEDILNLFKRSTFATEASRAMKDLTTQASDGMGRLYTDASGAASRLYTDASMAASRFAEDTSQKIDRLYADASQAGADLATKASEDASKFVVDAATEVAERVTKTATDTVLSQVGQVGAMFQAPSINPGDSDSASQTNQFASLFMKALGLLLLALLSPIFNPAPAAASTQALPEGASMSEYDDEVGATLSI
jgi:hypothetical protein